MSVSLKAVHPDPRDWRTRRALNLVIPRPAEGRNPAHFASVILGPAKGRNPGSIFGVSTSPETNGDGYENQDGSRVPRCARPQDDDVLSPLAGDGETAHD